LKEKKKNAHRAKMWEKKPTTNAPESGRGDERKLRGDKDRDIRCGE